MDHIFSGIIGSLIAILLWEGGGRFRRRLAEQAIRNFWNFLNKSVAIVLPHYRGTSGEFIMTNINDVLAVHLLTSFFWYRNNRSSSEFHQTGHYQGYYSQDWKK